MNEDEDDVILNNINKINNENNNIIIPQDKNNFNDFIESKEKEIKDVLLSKINYLEEELAKYKQQTSEILLYKSDLEKKNENNIKVIKEQEKDLNSYEYKFNNLTNDIKEKDEEIFELKNQIKNFENKLKNEKEEKAKNEEYNKYKMNKIKNQYQDEIKNLNLINDNLNNELKNIKTNIELIKDKNKEDKELYNEQKIIYEMKIKELQKKNRIFKK